jgi:ferredoxin-NADP reductase/predicted pyridoxine 5'-phosphate oxidase superfamily flavin-nucleotide-binding protein
LLSPEALDFVRTSPFLFIASRAGGDRIDVSPRGDLPFVLTIVSPDTLIMPDRPGNNRLDTVGNMLVEPKVCLAVLNPGADRFLRIRARSAVSVAPDDLAPFDIRGQAPLSVARLTITSADFITTDAFRRAQFWSPAATNLMPLDLFAMIKDQLAYHAERGVAPEPQHTSAQTILEGSNLSNAYRTPSHYVRRKAFAAFDPHTSAFLAASRFAVLAFCDENDELEITLIGGETGFASQCDERQLLARAGASPRGAIGGLFVRPGMPESLRLNGTVSEPAPQDGHIRVETREMFLHCSNSFVRSRIWRPRLAWNGKREFICRERRDEAQDVVSFLLAPADDAPLESFQAGQYVTLSGPEVNGRALERCYSLSNSPVGDHFRITVKRHDQGAVSCWLHDELKPGAMLLLGAPRGRFRIDDQSSRTVALISAGVGVTPMMSMLLHLASCAPDRPVWFFHGARDGGAHPMRNELRALAHPRLRTHIAHSRPRSQDWIGRDCDQHGRIDIATLDERLDLPGTDFYLCGPNDFMLTLKRQLIERGVPDKQIRLEIFGASGGAGTHRPDAPPAEVTLCRSGAKLTWTPADGTLLDLMLSKGVDAPYVCRQGDCQSCAQRLTGGEVAYPPDVDVEPAQGYVLLCQATPLGDVSIEI